MAGAVERDPAHQNELGLGVNQEQLYQNHKEAKKTQEICCEALGEEYTRVFVAFSKA